MRTKKKIAASSSDRIQLSLPTRWEDLTEKQLRYVCFLQCLQLSAIQLHTYCFVRFTGIKVHKETETGWGCSIRKGWSRKTFFLKTWEVHYFLKKLNYLNDPGTSVVRLSRMGKYMAVDRLLHGVPFTDYLTVENYYQGYLYTRKEDMLQRMAVLLYKDKNDRQPKKRKFSSAELYSVFQWYYALKNLFAVKFPYFFQRVEQSEEQKEIEMPDMEGVMNSQIRALTGGDITKEKEILQMDTWRALTELNEKAREVKELEEKK